MAKNVTTTNEDVEVMENTQKEAVSVLDLLLGADAGKIKLPTKEVEITRLSEIFGKPFILTCQALTPEKYEEVQDMAVQVSGKDVDLDLAQLQLFTVMEGVIDENGNPLFKSKELRTKYKVPTPKEVVRKVLLSGEIVAVYTEIAKLTGFDDGAVKQVKN